MCGAEHIFAAGHEKLESYPLYTSVLELRGQARPDPEKVRCLFPVTETTVSRWRSIYNEKMAGVDNAGILESREEAQNAPTPITNYALFYDGEYVTNEQMNDKKFLKLVNA